MFLNLVETQQKHGDDIKYVLNFIPSWGSFLSSGVRNEALPGL